MSIPGIRVLCVAFIVALLAAPAFFAKCPVPAKQGTAPTVAEIRDAIDKAAQNKLGADGPSYSKLKKGVPSTNVEAGVPCIILRAIGYTESRWKQVTASPGRTGPTLISFDCGYGVMQITSGMSGGFGFDPTRVASSYEYNIGTGAKILIDKWNVTPPIGDRDPGIAEDWYFAVWAYNGFSFINNPNNPRYDPNRVPFSGNQPRTHYPYQEIVWGYAAHPPGSEFWTATPLTLPKRALIKNKPKSSDNIARPLPAHTSGCPGGPPDPPPPPGPGAFLGIGITWLILILIVILLLIAGSLVYYYKVKKRGQRARQ